MELKLSCIPVVAQRPCWVYKWSDHEGPGFGWFVMPACDVYVVLQG